VARTAYSTGEGDGEAPVWLQYLSGVPLAWPLGFVNICANLPRHKKLLRGFMHLCEEIDVAPSIVET
jgi:hypothetical protein